MLDRLLTRLPPVGYGHRFISEPLAATGLTILGFAAGEGGRERADDFLICRGRRTRPVCGDACRLAGVLRRWRAADSAEIGL